MKTIYTASHIVDAHMIVNLLEQHELKAFVQGEYLQAAAGELPAGQLIRVEIAELFYGKERIRKEYWKTSSIRQSILRLCRLGQKMVDGGYVELLHQ